MIDTTLPCPFIYANGKQCKGQVYRAVAYGQRPDGTVKKWRLHCSEKGDHAGFGSVGKERMEFYPDRLPAGMIQKLMAAGVVESR